MYSRGSSRCGKHRSSDGMHFGASEGDFEIVGAVERVFSVELNQSLVRPHMVQRIDTETVAIVRLCEKIGEMLRHD